MPCNCRSSTLRCCHSNRRWFLALNTVAAKRRLKPPRETSQRSTASASSVSHPEDEPTAPDVGVRASYNVPIGTWPIPAPESDDKDDDRGTLRDLIMRECASRTTGTVGGVRRVVDGVRRTDLIDLLRCVSLYHLIKLLLLTILLLHKLWFPHQLLDLCLQPFQLFDPLSRLQLNVLLDALVRLE
ncbi:hypothetical protein Q3G72_018822 [Acer saccharum]|nr:hypothetical protein Q3G72_018822 [Acer saccharum]